MNNPLNVVINAMEIPSEILSIFPVAIMLNVFIIPITVPNNPNEGNTFIKQFKKFLLFFNFKTK